jgi:Na+/melibiose symporter-like transporter
VIKHNVSLPIKNIVAIVSAIVVAVWTYFGIVERLNRLETNEKLMAQDLLKKAEQTPKNQELYMLIEYQAKDNRETYKTTRGKRTY